MKDLFNLPIKKTFWYQSAYGDAVKMKNWNTSFLDLVNLGSSAAKFGLNYLDFQINAANWAMQPQSLIYDFAILKHYHPFIKKNGIVLLLLCPFHLLSVANVHIDRYHYFLPPHLVKNFHKKTLKRITKNIENPLLGAPKTAMKAFIRMMLGKDQPKSQNAKIAASKWIAGWKKQFFINDFTDPLSEENLKGMAFKIDLLCEMANFCKEHSLQPVFGIMPASKTLKEQIPEDFMQRAFYNAVEKVKKRAGLQFLDYYRSPEFESDELYLDSFLMNEKGAKMFTKRVLTDLDL